jgi:hypothetical protein
VWLLSISASDIGNHIPTRNTVNLSITRRPGCPCSAATDVQWIFCYHLLLPHSKALIQRMANPTVCPRRSGGSEGPNSHDVGFGTSGAERSFATGCVAQQRQVQKASNTQRTWNEVCRLGRESLLVALLNIWASALHSGPSSSKACRTICLIASTFGWSSSLAIVRGDIRMAMRASSSANMRAAASPLRIHSSASSSI